MLPDKDFEFMRDEDADLDELRALYEFVVSQIPEENRITFEEFLEERKK